MRADRLVATLLTLQARGRVTAAQLAEELEVSVATARRDLEALSAAGIPVYPQAGRGGGWQLLGGARTDLSGLTGPEARALFLLVGPAASVDPDAKAALRKLVRALPESFRTDAAAAAEAVVIDAGEWGRPAAERPELLPVLEAAIVQRRRVRLRYAAWNREPADRVVDPWGLVHKQEHWYLLGAVEGAERTYRVDRILEASVTDEAAERPDGLDLAAMWERVTADVERQRAGASATVIVDAGIIPLLRTQFGQRAIEEAPVDPMRSRVRVTAPTEQLLARGLAGWAEYLEVEAPASAARGAGAPRAGDRRAQHGLTCSYEQGACPAHGGMIQWPRAKLPHRRSTSVGCPVHPPETSKRKTGAHVHSTPHRRRGRRSRPRPHGVDRRTGVRRPDPGADPRHERLPWPHPQQHDDGEAGAAVLAGAVKQLRAINPNTVFAAAGDLIGASTFESFIQHDKPTIDALNEAGLEVSAVGNHELDQGYNDLVNRVMAPYDATTNPFGGAQWQYIAANLKLKATGDDAVPATWIKEFGDVKVGFVGAVTEELPGLVSPGGIADIDVEGIVDSVNTEAADLVTEGADLVVMLVHEGAPTTNCATMNHPARRGATSSTTSRPTSTPSFRDTRTWPTTARSLFRHGPGGR